MSLPEPVPAQKPPLKERFEKLLVEYGYTAFVVYFASSGLVLAGFLLAIRAGVHFEGILGTAGTWVAAWLALKLTQPWRFMGTIAVTPVVVKFVHRFKRRRLQG